MPMMSASVKLLQRIHTLSDNAHENNFFWHEHRSVENDGNETLRTHAQQAEHETLRHQHERPQQQVEQIISAAATDEYNEV